MNRPKGQFYIKPYVKSANIPADTKRMGDLRLECQVRWAIEKQDVSFVFSTYVKLLASGNPCMAGTVAVYFFAPHDVESVTLDTEKLKLSFSLNADNQYTLPLEKNEISDDSLVNYKRRTLTVTKSDN